MEGELRPGGGWQQLPLATKGRYVKLTGTSSRPEDDPSGLGNPWMAVAELMVSTPAGKTLPGVGEVPEMVPAIVTIEGADPTTPAEPTQPGTPSDPGTPGRPRPGLLSTGL